MMAVAEARAVWQRTVNRCLVQEDAKRAPKLACCPSPLTQQDGVEPTRRVDSVDAPALGPVPFTRNSLHSNVFPDSRWWLQYQPSGAYSSHYVVSDNDSDLRSRNCVNDDDEYRKQDLISKDLAELGDAKGLFESAVMVPGKKSDDYDSGSPWDMNEKTEPWWRTTDKDELALLVSKRSSFGLVENCDLPQPQKRYKKVESSADFGSFKRDDTHPPLKVPKYPSVNQAELLEALCHSQTRAREAERAAKEAKAEKEHIMKLVFRQASQLFAYKQWFHLLQLENLCKHNSQNESVSSVLLPLMMPWTTRQENTTPPRKLEKNSQKGKHRDKAGHSSTGDGGGGCCLSNCAVAIALGLSLVGAGLLLGWTLGCFLPPF